MDVEDVLALIGAIGAVVTAILNYLHGKDDGKTVEAMVEAIDKQREDTAVVTDNLNDAFRDVMSMLKAELKKRQP